ncbi:pentatricopeptide repeat-containing protein [Senna tora]|uniref:Pentatricopeptide repeat-containing protein n=1 Tax=Senna tora TaxID=362788 RepID=A0A834XHY7_9FABA|nr:pentatricopeptide repeat-containing protein [Senna tora]
MRVLCNALSSCAKTLNWNLGIRIHAYMIHSGYEDNLFLSSALVDFYAKCGAIADASKVFSGMKTHDQVSWTSLIAGFSMNGQGRDALLLFKEMLDTQVKPNCFTYSSVISACVEQKEALEQCSTLHAHVIKRGFKNNKFVISSLLDCYAKCRQIDDAVLLFDETSEKDTILYNSLISGYSQNLYSEDALKLFVEMRKKDLRPTDHTLSSILNACGSLTVLLQGRQLHSLVIKMGSERNVFVTSALIDMYSKGGDIDEARRVLDLTAEKNSVLWTSMIMGYAQCGRGSEALELFDHLLTEQGFIPDHVCFTAVLTACNHAGFLDKGVEYFNKMRTHYGLSPDQDQYGCLIDLYARNGNLRKAKDLMEEMPYNANRVIWSSFLSFCKIHGEVELGREAANQLIKMDPHNAVPYITLAHIYARNGLWTEAAEVRSLMQRRRLRKPAGWSWIEVDKHVHVFGVGDVAHSQSNEIYAELEKIYLGMIFHIGVPMATARLLELASKKREGNRLIFEVHQPLIVANEMLIDGG